LEEHDSSRSTRSSRLARLARQSWTCRVESSQVEFEPNRLRPMLLWQDPGNISHCRLMPFDESGCGLSRLENGRLSDRYRIGIDTGCIVSNRIDYCCIGRYYVHPCRFISYWRVALHTMTKGHSSAPSPARRVHTRACCFMVHDTGEGWRGGRRKETVTWYQLPRDTKMAQYWSWPPSRRTPSTSRKW